MKRKFQVKTFDTKTLRWWFSKRSQIDMNPPYQRRGGLWSDTDKAYLIDSILNGYDIPKIYIADFTWGDSELNKKKLPYAIIDGKQRFEAIFDFYNGNLVLNDDFIYLSDPRLKLGGLSFKDLENNYKDIAEDFDNFPPIVMCVITKEEETINELFVRLNRSKALTGAEVRNAMKGPTPQVIRQISKHEFFENNIKFNVRRGQDLNAAAKLLLFEYKKDFGDTQKKHLDNFVEETANGNGKLELAGRYVIDVLDVMSEIFLPKDKVLTSSGIIPVYYWFIKNVDDVCYSKVRKFLVTFESKRIENRNLVKNEPHHPEINISLVEYDNYNRSTNNSQSHKERYRILLQFFNKWDKTNRI
jgi:Protein of unknown function DUF262